MRTRSEEVRSENKPAAVLTVRVEYDYVPNRFSRNGIVEALQELNEVGDVKIAILDISQPLSIDLREEL